MGICVQTDGGDDGHRESMLALVGGFLRTEPEAARFLASLRASPTALTAAYDEYVLDLGGSGDPAGA